jgi:hypothetical protein
MSYQDNKLVLDALARDIKAHMEKLKVYAALLLENSRLTKVRHMLNKEFCLPERTVSAIIALIRENDSGTTGDAEHKRLLEEKTKAELDLMNRLREAHVPLTNVGKENKWIRYLVRIARRIEQIGEKEREGKMSAIERVSSKERTRTRTIAGIASRLGGIPIERDLYERLLKSQEASREKYA